MQSESQSHVLKATESLVLDCDFHAEHFNLFDYPVLWRKSQTGKLRDDTATHANENNDITVRLFDVFTEQINDDDDDDDDIIGPEKHLYTMVIGSIFKRIMLKAGLA